MEDKKINAGGQTPEEKPQSGEFSSSEQNESPVKEPTQTEEETVLQENSSSGEMRERLPSSENGENNRDEENSPSAAREESEPPQSKEFSHSVDDRLFNTVEMKSLDEWNTEDKDHSKETEGKSVHAGQAEEQKEMEGQEPSAKASPLFLKLIETAHLIQAKLKVFSKWNTGNKEGEPDRAESLEKKLHIQVTDRKKVLAAGIAASLILLGTLGVGAYAFDAFDPNANAPEAQAPAKPKPKPKPAKLQLYLENDKFELDLRTIGYNGEDVSTIDQEKLRSWLEEVNKKVYQPAQNAEMKRLGDEITPEKPGRKMDVKAVEAWLSDLKPLINKPQEIPMIPLEPLVTAEDLRQVDEKLIGDYRTKFDGSNVNRTTNIRLAARAINGLILMPGEKFSFNKVVGPRTAARGYKKAAVIVKGEFSEGIGGGICQVSSTLFNSVDEAGLRIVARYHHSAEVTYVPPGRDATVSWGGPDFKFRNNLNKPVLIKIKVGANSITVYTYTVPGAKVHKKKVEDAPESFKTIKVDPDKPTDQLPKTDNQN